MVSGTREFVAYSGDSPYPFLFDKSISPADQDAIITSPKMQAVFEKYKAAGWRVDQIRMPWAQVVPRGQEHLFLFGAIEVDAVDKQGEKIKANIEVVRGDAVCVLPVITDKKTRQQYVWLTQQTRLPTGDEYFFEVPAGMVDTSLDPHKVASKEAEEETGLEIKPEEFFTLNPSGKDEPMYTSPGLLDEGIYLYGYQKEVDNAEAYIKEQAEKKYGVAGEGEAIASHIVKIEDALAVVGHDMKSALAIQVALQSPAVRLARIDPYKIASIIEKKSDQGTKEEEVADYIASTEVRNNNVGFFQTEKIVHDVLIHNDIGEQRPEVATQQIIEEIKRREQLAHKYLSFPIDEFRRQFIEHIDEDWILLETLRDGWQSPLGQKFQSNFPHLVNYAQLETDVNTHTQDYQKGGYCSEHTDISLFEKVIERSVGQKLAGLFQGNYEQFAESFLSRTSFEEDAHIVHQFAEYGLAPFMKAVVTYLDIAKGGDRSDREHMLHRYRIDPLRHNEAAAMIVRQDNIFEKLGIFRDIQGLEPGQQSLLAEFGAQLINYHGLVGQKVRGEVTGYIFEGFTHWVRDHYDDLVKTFSIVSGGKINKKSLPNFIAGCLHMVNVVDASAVRSGLYTDALREQFMKVEDDFQKTITRGVDNQYMYSWDQQFIEEQGNEIDTQKRYVIDRIQRLRAGNIASKKETGRFTEYTVARLQREHPAVFQRFLELFSHCQQWYTENATSCFFPEDQMKLLFLGMRMAQVSGVDVSKNYDLSFVRLMNKIRSKDGTYDYFKRKVIEVKLGNMSWNDLMDDDKVRAWMQKDSQTSDNTKTVNGFMALQRTNYPVVEINFGFTPDTEAAFTLLQKIDQSSTQFKTLAELIYTSYGLKSDEWDRVLDERDYIDKMESEAAIDDKNQIGIYFPQGAKTIASIGAGGGGFEMEVAKRWLPQDGKLFAIDYSDEMIRTLRKVADDSEPRIVPVKGDALEINSLPALQDQIFDAIYACSVIHEIRSFNKQEEKFIDPNIAEESMKKAVVEAFAKLRTGGRFIIRDMMWPEEFGEKVKVHFGKMRKETGDEMEPTKFVKEYLDKYRGYIEDRDALKERIKTLEAIGQWVPDGDNAWLELSKAEAFELMYHYSWHKHRGRELMEQYGCYDPVTYRKVLQQYLQEAGYKTHVVMAKAYAQPGYEEHLRGRMTMKNRNGEELPYPKGTGIVVLEKD